MMRHSLIQRLFDDCGYPEITWQNHARFVAQPGVNVLFFPGDPALYRDSTDVAVVLPELDKAFSGLLRPGVVTEADGQELQQHYGFSAWPALVFVREDGYLGAICGIRNWADYLREIEALLVAEPRRPPGIGIPLVVDGEPG